LIISVLANLLNYFIILFVVPIVIVDSVYIFASPINNNMTTAERKGVVIERAMNVELRKEIKVGELIWHFYSDKTGHHQISQRIEKGNYLTPMSERAAIHWNGFKANQNR
jgi:hypothetical protein